MAAKNKTPGGGGRAGALDNVQSQRRLHPNTGAAQRLRILKRLRHAPANTIELRRDLDVMMPAARVHELRHRFGCAIDTLWTQGFTDAGRRHRIALYVLRKIKGKRAA